MSRLWLFISILWVSQAAAQQIPPQPNPPRLVNDVAGILLRDEAERLEAKLDAYNDSTSTQIAIVTMKTTGDDEISDVAIKILRTWGIGTKKNDNGIVILVAVDDHKIRIETGSGMEGALPDVLCYRIIDGVIAPQFKEGHYYQGLDEGVDKIIQAAAGEYKDIPAKRRRENDGPIGFIVLVIIIVVIIILRNRGGGGGTTFSRRGWGGGWIAPLGGFGSWGSGSSGSSWGGGGGGGFGGFGGGSGSGGGASGSW